MRPGIMERCLLHYWIFRTFLPLIACCINAMAFAEGKPLRFNVSPDGFPPFMIVNEHQPPTGIMVEVLENIAEKLGFSLIPMEIPRKRVEQMLTSGELNVTPRAIEWTHDPDAFEFSDPIVHVREVVFVTKESDMSKLEDLFGKRLGTRLGYEHRALDPYFMSNRIIRDDSPNEFAAFEKLLLGRIDAVSCLEWAGLWVIKQNHWRGRFKIFEKEVSSAGYRLMFAKKWKPFVQQFNQELAKMKQSGELDSILAEYRCVPPCIETAS